MSMSNDLSFATEYLPTGYKIRTLEAADYANGVLEVLGQLTFVGSISKEKFDEYVTELDQSDTRRTLVILNEKQNVSAIGTLLLERKLIHECGSVGHIEDISVEQAEQGRRLGYTMIQILDALAKRKGAYKCILNCTEELKSFYEKCGYKSEGHVMVSMKMRRGKR